MEIREMSLEELRKMEDKLRDAKKTIETNKKQAVYEATRGYDEELELSNRELKEVNGAILNLIKANPFILNFIPHDRTTCSDSEPVNGFSHKRGRARCRKCHLLEILEDHSTEYKISFSVDITQNA